jgi:DNA-binding CsgD family transcriptional regulator
LRPSPGLLGRETEWTACLETLQGARAGRLQVLLLSGPPGIGKTRLAEEAAQAAQAAGLLALEGAWREEAELPEFWIWRQVLRRLLGSLDLPSFAPGLEPALSELSALLPELGERLPALPAPLGDAGDPDRLRLLEAVQRVLRRAAARRPLLVVLDNLHLAGPASLALLSGLLAELADSAIAVIATYRDLPIHLREPLLSFLSGVRRGPRARACCLENLRPAETAALAQDILEGRASEELLAQIQRSTGGNPLFVGEAARLYRGRLEEETSRRVRREMIPAAIGLTIASRLSQLPERCRELLRSAAVLGEYFTQEELGLLADDDGALEGGLQTLLEHGLLQAGGQSGEYRFTHAVVHEAIRSTLPARERQALCRRIAERVEGRPGAPLPLLALRLSGWWAAVPGPEARRRERRYLMLAAQNELREKAWEQASEHFGRLVEGREEAGSEEQAEAWFGLGRATLLSGERGTAVAHFRRAFAWYRQQGRTERMIAIATQTGYLNAGEPGFFNFYEQVLEVLPPGTAAAGMVLHFYSIAQLNSLGDYAGAEATARKAWRIGVECADASLQARCLVALAALAYRRFRPEESLPLLDQAEGALARTEDPYARLHCDMVRAQALVDLGRAAEAIPFFDRRLELARRLRDAMLVATAVHDRLRLEQYAGRWDAARRLAGEGLAALPRFPYLPACLAYMEYCLGRFAAGDAWRERILAASRRTPAGPFTVHLLAASTTAARARHSGDTRELGALLPTLRSCAAHPEAHPFIRLRAHLLLAYIGALAADPALAREGCQAARKRSWPYVVRPYHFQRILGLAAHACGEHGRAAEHLQEALRQARRFGDRPLEAWILCELAEALRAPDGQATDAARRSLRAARELAGGLGLAPLERRCAALLREPLPGAADPAHWHLSAREREVLRLVAAGRTNKEIAEALALSHYTVGNHLRKILAKTGAANRTEAVDLARRGGALPE